MTTHVRHLVSKNKRRHTTPTHDLDLTYITPSILAMGYPATGVESCYRNPLASVRSYLDSNHANRYKVYNLCSERCYPADTFEERVGRYPWRDHNVPPLGMLTYFCEDVTSWLGGHEDNVAVIHCKAGKGRTGVAICCFLLWCGQFQTAAEALEFYGERRTKDGEGVTIPSQRRFVCYFEAILKGSDGVGVEAVLSNMSEELGGISSTVSSSSSEEDSVFDPIDGEDGTAAKNSPGATTTEQYITQSHLQTPPAPTVLEHPPIDSTWNDRNRSASFQRGNLPPRKLVRLTGLLIHHVPIKKRVTGPMIANSFEPILRIQCGNYKYDSRSWTVNSHVPFGARSVLIQIPSIPVVDEVFVGILRRKNTPSVNKKKKLCGFWFHTSFVPDATPSLLLTKVELDKACKDGGKDEEFEREFAVELRFEKG